MTTLQKRQLKILEETAVFYREDVSRRAVINYQCEYYTPDGKKCAVGKLLTNKVAKKMPPGRITYLIDDGDVDNILPKSVRSLTPTFLGHLQEFHDRPEYWDKNGWTKAGMAHYDKMKKAIKNNEYVEND